MKRKITLFCLLLWSACTAMAQINVSTGISNAGMALPTLGVDPNWVIAVSPDGCSSATVVPAYLPYWQATPIPSTNAGWVNCTGNQQGNVAGNYTFERPFTIPPGTGSFSCNFRITWDDIFVSLELVPPTGPTIPLSVVTTSPYYLSQLITHIENSPQSGVWKIRAVINFFDSVGAFILSGDITNCDSLLPANLQSGLIAYYPFNGGSLLDYSPSGFHLTNPTAVPTPTTDRSGYANCAYRFTGGASDYLITAAPMPAGIIPSASIPFSISLWYKPASTTVGNYELLFGRNTLAINCPDGMGDISLGLYDCRKPVMRFEQTSCWDYSLNGLTDCGSITAQYIANGWQHLAAVYDPTQPPGSQYLIYRDGNVSNNLHGPCGTSYADVGSLFVGLAYTGELDDIFFYNRALSVTEVYQLMNLGSSCCSGNIVAVKSPEPDVKLMVYPNPHDGRAKLKIPAAIGAGAAELTVFDQLGEAVLHQAISQGVQDTELVLDWQNRPAGVYFIRLSTQEKVYFCRMVKQ